jgi:hypothetical protein
MGIQTVNTAQLACSFGTTPSALAVLPTNKVLCNAMPAANVLDTIPLTNILSFGMCMSPANPVVAAATAAALGVLTPMPCVPATSAPWTPGVPKVLIAGKPAADNACTCMCEWGGVISVVSPGQAKVSEA